MALITNGNATVYVEDMSRAVDFYTRVLGLTLKARYGDHWAEVLAGHFMIGLHPKSDGQAKPGTRGSIQVGLVIDEPIEQAVAKLHSSNVPGVGEIHRGEGGNFVHFTDPDGNELYLWETPKFG